MWVSLVIVLALGIGLSAAVFAVVYGVVLRPLPFAEPDELVLVFEGMPRADQAVTAVSAADFADMRAEQMSFDRLTAFDGRELELSVAAGESERITRDETRSPS